MATTVSQGEAPLQRIAAAVREVADSLEQGQRRVRDAAARATAAARQEVRTVHAATQADADALAAQVERTTQAAVDAARLEATAASEAVDEAARRAAEVVRTAAEDLHRALEVNDSFHAPYDALAGDSWVSLLLRRAAAPKDFASGLEALERSWFSEDVGALAQAADHGEASWEQVAAQYGRFAAKSDAASAFSQQWLSDTALLRGVSPVLEGLAKVTGPTAIVGDLAVAVAPPDEGAMGWVDRGAAVTNGGLIAADLALGGIPVVGEVAIVATGVYLGGNYLYHHWTPFHDLCDTVGNTTVSVAKDVGHAVGSAASSVGHEVGSVASGLGHDVGSAAQDVGGWLGL